MGLTRRLKRSSMLPELKLNDTKRHSFTKVRRITRRSKLSMPWSVEQAAWMLKNHPEQVVSALMFEQLHQETNKEVS